MGTERFFWLVKRGGHVMAERERRKEGWPRVRWGSTRRKRGRGVGCFQHARARAQRQEGKGALVGAAGGAGGRRKEKEMR